MAKLTDRSDLAPTPEYEFNNFLLRISDELTEDDLERMKFLCEGELGIKKRNLEKITKPFHFFRILRERGLLDLNNMLSLQSLLWHLPRRDLQDKYVKFAASQNSMLYFVVPNDQPENGYEYVEFHIKGKNLDNYDKDSLEELRSMISRIVFVPPQFVVIKGIEPSNSIKVTVMIPAPCVDFLLKIARISKTQSSLAMASVSKITTKEETIDIKGKNEEIEKQKENSTMNRELSRVLKRYKEKENAFEDLEYHSQEIEIKLESTQKSYETFKNEFSLLMLVNIFRLFLERYTMFIQARREFEAITLAPIDPLSKMTAFRYFRFMMRKIKEMEYDENLILSLLDAQALVFQWQKGQSKDIQIADLQNTVAAMSIRIRSLENNLTVVTWERDKLAYYHKIGERHEIMSQQEKFFLAVLSQNVPLSLPVNLVIQPVSPECLEHVLRSLSKELTKTNMKHLLKESSLKGKERQESEHSAYAFLMNSFKVAEANAAANKQQIDILGVLGEILRPLEQKRRDELIAKANKFIQTFCTQQQKQSMEREMKTKQPEKSEAKGKQEQKPFSKSHSDIDNKDDERYNSLSDRLLKMEEMLQRIDKSTSPLNMLTANPHLQHGQILGKWHSFLESSGLAPKFKGA